MSIDLTAAVKAAGHALHDRHCPDLCDPSYYTDLYELDARAAVTAAAPLIEQAVREQIAETLVDVRRRYRQRPMLGPAVGITAAILAIYGDDL